MANLTIREERQREAVESFEDKGLIRAAPRFGKIKVSIDILRKYDPKRILISYPRNDIKEGWLKDFEKWRFHKDVEFQTFTSIDKEHGKEFDFHIIDEIHEASPNQLSKLGKIKAKNTLALSGTCTNKTLEQIAYHTGITTCYNYSIARAVEEGILCDYQIVLHEVPLDEKTLVNGKTEKARFRALEWVKEKLIREKKPTFFLDLKQIAIIQNSLSKLKRTRELLKEYKDERVLVFCGTTEIADNLGIPVYHSKKKEEQVFKDFCNGKGSHLATIKMAQSGITVLPINKGLINYTSGNPEDTAQKICRFLGLEYDTPDKKAEIHMVISNEKFEKERIQTALMFFDKNKIKLGQ